jgi:NNP family nitrate/nitrite transporter-like MFS transporter
MTTAAMGARLAYWDPEDRRFWRAEGALVARRNLAISAAALVLSFAVWMLWSVVVVILPHVGYRFSTEQLFWLAAAPGLAGGTLRLLFSFLVPIFGGRAWTALSTLLLLVPCVGLGFALQDPATGYPTFLLLALAAGIGGGNFASSVANISFFFPAERKGFALGVNAGIGNLGIPLAQFVLPLAVAVPLFGTLAGGPLAFADAAGTRDVWLQNAGFAWVPAIVIVAALAWWRMDDVDAVRASLGDQAGVVLRRETWVLSWLYLGTFGSYVGFAAGFPLVAETQFAGVDPVLYAFTGPLLAALARPAGGLLADRYGGANVAVGCFAAMALAVAALLAGPRGYGPFLAWFAVLFTASGVGNGAVFQLIPAVFARVHERLHPDAETAARAASLEAAAALGLASGIAAFGGFFIPKAYGTAVATTGGTDAALVLFLAFYLSCIATAWWFRGRRPMPRSA